MTITEARALPEEYLRWMYHGRSELAHRQAEGEQVPAHEIFLGFTRYNPAIVSYGPAYIFTVEEVFDNSATKNGFGRHIWPV